MLEQERARAEPDDVTIIRTDDAHTWQFGDEVEIIVDFPTQEGDTRQDWVFRRTTIVRVDGIEEHCRVLVLDESTDPPVTTWVERSRVRLRGDTNRFGSPPASRIIGATAAPPTGCGSPTTG